MKILFSWWVQPQFTIDHKSNCVISEKCLVIFNRISDEALWHFIEVNETWIQYHKPQTNQQLPRYVSPGESAPKKARVSLPAQNVMTTVFCHTWSIIYIDNLQKGRTIHEDFYANLLHKFKEKRPLLGKKRPFCHKGGRSRSHKDTHLRICYWAMLYFLQGHIPRI